MIEKILLSILILVLPGIIFTLILFNKKEATLVEFYSLSQAFSIVSLAFITSILLFFNIIINIYIIYLLITIFIIIIFLLKIFAKIKVKFTFDKYQFLALIFLTIPISYYILYFYSEPYFSLTPSGDPFSYNLHYKTLYEGNIFNYYIKRQSIFAPSLFLISFPLDIPFSFISIRYLIAYFDILTGLMIYSATLISTRNKKWSLIALICFNIILFVNFTPYFISGLFSNILANFMSFALIYLIFFLKEENIKSYFFLILLSLGTLTMHISVGLLFITLTIYFLLSLKIKIFETPRKNILVVLFPFFLLIVLGFTIIKSEDIPLLVYFFQYALGETGFWVISPEDQNVDWISDIINTYFKFFVPYISIAAFHPLLSYPLLIIPFISYKFYKEKFVSFSLFWFFVILLFSNLFFAHHLRFSYQLYLPITILLAFFIFKSFDKFTEIINDVKLIKKPFYALGLIFLILVSISTGIFIAPKFTYKIYSINVYHNYENDIFEAMNYIKDNFKNYTVVSTVYNILYLNEWYNITVIYGIYKPHELNNLTKNFLVIISKGQYYYIYNNFTETLNLVYEYEKAGFKKVFENNAVVIFSQ